MAILAQIISFPISLLVMAGITAAFLPTTFSRGFLVALCYLLVIIFIAVVVGLIIGALFMASTLLAH